MRKAVLSMQARIMVAIVLVLLAFIIFVAMSGSAKGKIADAVGLMRDSMDDWACATNIGNVDVAGFMASLDRVYKKCDTDKKCKLASCELMMLTEDIHIDRSVLESYGQTQYFELGRPSIACNEDCGSVSPTIYAIYPKTYTREQLLSMCKGRWNNQLVQNMCAQPDASYFGFAAGTKLLVSGTHVEGGWLPPTPTYTYMKVIQR